MEHAGWVKAQATGRVADRPTFAILVGSAPFAEVGFRVAGAAEAVVVVEATDTEVSKLLVTETGRCIARAMLVGITLGADEALKITVVSRTVFICGAVDATSRLHIALDQSALLIHRAATACEVVILALAGAGATLLSNVADIVPCAVGGVQAIHAGVEIGVATLPRKAFGIVVAAVIKDTNGWSTFADKAFLALARRAASTNAGTCVTDLAGVALVIEGTRHFRRRVVDSTEARRISRRRHIVAARHRAKEA